MIPADRLSLEGAVGPLSPRQVKRLGRAMPKRLRFTGEGKLLVVLSLGIGTAAVNSGNNLLYLVFGLLLSLIMVSGVLSELNLRKVRVSRVEPPHLHAGSPGLIAVHILNGKKRLSTLSVEVSELFGRDWEDAGTKQRKGFVMLLRPGQQATTFIRLTPGHRGLMTSAGLRVATRFPFGFFEKSRFFPLPHRYVVYPPASESSDAAPRLAHVGTEQETGRAGQGEEFYALRDHRPGDDARDIAWKVTARRDKVVIREYERPGTREVIFVVGNVIPPVTVARQELEAAIERVGALAQSYATAGYAVGVASIEGGVRPTQGPAAVTAIFEHLASLPVRTVPSSLSEFSAVGVLGDTAFAPRAERIWVATATQERLGFSPKVNRRIVVGLPGLEGEVDAALEDSQKGSEQAA